MGSHATRMSNGQTVMLADWHDQRPPQHGEALLQKAWNSSHDRSGLAFYDSTVNLMRNEQAVALMPSVTFTHENKTYRLFMNEDTRTWHSPEALDIDHRTEWKQHLVNKRVTNYADANMAYNDTDNLRLLPSCYNRSRNKVDRLLEGGLETPEWRAWLKENTQFDPNATHRAFDPVNDKARRQQSTREATWSPEDGRSGLQFDTRVKSVWLEHELSKRYALTVDIPDAETGQVAFSVPLFHCATTGQLVTRDAFDIDHRRPISDVLEEKCRNSDTGTISKAEALDAYNDVGNLQLVSRSANCSHEWERDALGQFDGEYDFGPDDPEVFIDDRAPRVVAAEGLAFEEGARDDIEDELPRTGRKRTTDDRDAELIAARGGDDLPEHPLEPPRKRISPERFDEQPDRPALINSVSHPGHKLYVDAHLAMNRYDHSGQIFGHGEVRDTIAAALAVEAQRGHLHRIDHVTTSREGGIFATQGDLGAPASMNVGTTYFQATNRSVEAHSQESNQLPPPPQPPMMPPSQTASMHRS